MSCINRKDLYSVFLVLIIACFTAKIAIPLPLSEKAKEAQRSAKCLDNLRLCLTAIEMYWNDYDGMLPSSVVVTKTSDPNPPQDVVVKFLTAKDPWPLPENTQAKSWAHLISPCLKHSNALFCPSDTPRSTVSFWWKYAIDLGWRGMVDPGTGEYIAWRKDGDFDDTANRIILYEHAGWHSGDASGIKDGVKINVGYLDGHTATVTLKNGPASYPSVEDERSGAASTRLGAPMYYNYDNVTKQRHPGVANFINASKYSDLY